MTAPSLHAVRATRRLVRWIRAGLFLIGLAAAVTVAGFERLATGAVLLVLLVQLLSLEELRVLSLTFREKLK